MSEDFNLEFVDNAWEWYQKHTEHVERLKKLDINRLVPYFAPSNEDRNHPELWKPGHWRWFFENYHME